MIAVFDEYQVLVSDEDITYTVGQKARNGGTFGLVTLGYHDVRVTHEGREVRTVAVDRERAPYVTMAFESYATGSSNFAELRDAPPRTRACAPRATAATARGPSTPAATNRSSTKASATGCRRCSVPSGAPEPGAAPIRVVPIDDDELVRAGLREIVEAEADVTVVGEIAEGDAAVLLVDGLRPTIVLLDVRMPHMDGREPLRQRAAQDPVSARRFRRGRS
ncbi:MAG: response regulator transcription factor [Dermatophilaceae bacterium]